MARLVRHESTTPIKFDPNLVIDPANPPPPNVRPWPRDENGNPKILSICACGVSATFPICDGMHKHCRTEEPGMVYTYDVAAKTVKDKKPE
jgi:hypothetical protein